MLNQETLNQETLFNIVNEATIAANRAALEFRNTKLGGEDQMPCGFAWVQLFSYNGKKITGATKIGKMLKNVGVSQSYDRKFQLWGPGNYPGQNVDAHFAGAEAARDVFNKHGFEAVANSRWD